MRIETRAIHAGRHIDPATGAVTQPICLSTTFERSPEGEYPHGYIYSRDNNPNRRSLEECLADLEGGTQALAFNSAGALVTPANGNLAFTPVQPTNGATFPTTMNVNVTNTTQFGTAYAPGTINQNGFEAGTLSNVQIGNDGIVTAYYSNNQTSQLGQVAVANFANLQGLQQIGNNSWASSSASGTPVLGTASAGQFGDIEQGQLETSNTSDTTAQLVDMIQAQRNYQANAQVLSTDNTLASSLFNAVSR